MVSVTNGGLLTDKVADVNLSIPGTIYLSFVGIAYGSQSDLMTVTFRAIENVDKTSTIAFRTTELYDRNLDPIT